MFLDFKFISGMKADSVRFKSLSCFSKLCERNKPLEVGSESANKLSTALLNCENSKAAYRSSSSYRIGFRKLSVVLHIFDNFSTAIFLLEI